MIPTIQNAKDAARRHLGDAEVSGGQVFTDAVLNPYIAQAYGEMLRTLDDFNVQLVERNLYYVLPANQTVFYPAQAGHNNFGEPGDVRTRNPRLTGTISNAVPAVSSGYCTITTDSAHGLTTGDTVIIYGVGGVSFDINDEWTVEVVDTTNFRLLGCRATGTYSSGSDFFSSADDNWSDPLRYVDSVAEVRKAVADNEELVAWERDRFIFSRSTQARQIMIEYSLSGSLAIAEDDSNDSDSLGVDDCLDYMGYRAASFAAADFGADQAAADMESRAIGSRQALDAGSPGGLLGNMVSRGVQALQKESFETMRWRPKRNAGVVPNFI